MSSMHKTLLLIVLCLSVASVGKTANASGEACVTMPDNSRVYTSRYNGASSYNEQTAGTNLMPTGSNMDVYEVYEIDTSYTPLRVFGTTTIISGSSTVALSTIFNNFGAGTYYAFSNQGFLNACGDALVGSGHAYFTINSLGTVTYKSLSDYEEAEIPDPTIAYAVITEPSNGSYITSPVDFSVAWNIPNSATSSIRITFLSLDQDLSSYTYTASSSSGQVQVENTTVTFPYYDDIIYVRAYIYENDSATGIPSYISKEYTYNYVANGDVTGINLGAFQTTASTSCANDGSLGSGICNSFRFLFVPSEESLNALWAVRDSVASRTPFVYLYQMPTLYENLFNSTTTNGSTTISASTSIGTITFVSSEMLSALPFAGTMKTIMEYVLWVMLALTIYYRVMKIHDKETTI